MKRDMKEKVFAYRGLSPVSVSDNTPAVSQIMDCANFGAVMAVIALGSIADADATFQVLVEDGDASNLSDNAAVADEYLVGIEGNGSTTGASFQFDSDNGIRTIGYTGPKRYVRVTITPSGNASAALLSMIWLAMFARSGVNTAQTV